MKHRLPSLAMARRGAMYIILFLFLGPVAIRPSVVTAENINKNKSLETDTMVIEEVPSEPEKAPVKKLIIKPKEIVISKLNVTATGSRGLVQKYAAQYEIDWKLVEAIVLHETGNRTSYAYKNKHNSCGMMGKKGLLSFSSEELGVEACVKNLKNRYISQGLTTPELINTKYASSKTWATKINYYYNKL